MEPVVLSGYGLRGAVGVLAGWGVAAAAVAAAHAFADDASGLPSPQVAMLATSPLALAGAGLALVTRRLAHVSRDGIVVTTSPVPFGRSFLPRASIAFVTIAAVEDGSDDGPPTVTWNVVVERSDDADPWVLSWGHSDADLAKCVADAVRRGLGI